MPASFSAVSTTAPAERHPAERHKAGACILREGSKQLTTWFDEQRQRLLDDQAPQLVQELRNELAAISRTGPGNKGRRGRLDDALLYIERRTSPS